MGQGRLVGTIWSQKINGRMTAQVEAFGLGSLAMAILVQVARAQAQQVVHRGLGEAFGTGFSSFCIMDFSFFWRVV